MSFGASSSSSMAPVGGSLGKSVSEKLTGENFLIWKTQVLPPIRGAQLTGYLDGTVPEPEKEVAAKDNDGKDVNIPNPEYARWIAQDQTVLGYLWNMTREVPVQVAGLSSSVEVWTAVKEMFSLVSKAHVFFVLFFHAQHPWPLWPARACSSSTRSQPPLDHLRAPAARSTTTRHQQRTPRAASTCSTLLPAPANFFPTRPNLGVDPPLPSARPCLRSPCFLHAEPPGRLDPAPACPRGPHQAPPPAADHHATLQLAAAPRSTSRRITLSRPHARSTGLHTRPPG
ncbi:hypothetical protein QYE76_004223 [Lolium multiflorum]|uniref:Retrotransposon Copia-like N-terminal domain-containing protein n=1 Tax=Lolium multiflorum TaxID=4521 RepID=A0AAD8RQA8_LOLMU|nr:hypothetical protein QYE76_004223 [Lolium multiflorum]